MRGFTLIEALIYIALYSFIIGSVVLCVYGLSQNGDLFASRNSVSGEGEFVTAKLNWAMGSLKSIDYPTSGYDTVLRVTRTDDSKVWIKFENGIVKMSTDSGANYTDLTTTNVTVDALGFKRISGTPSGIEASTTINGITFMTRRYLQQ